MNQVTTERHDVVAGYRAVFGKGRSAVGSMLGGHVETRSQGSWISTRDGRSFLDCGGYGVFTLGHRHPEVVASVRAQLDTHPLGSRVFFEPRALEAAGRLVDIAPAGLDFVQFVNSGAEATEFAIKAARAAGCINLICTTGGFHGKTMGALSVTTRPTYQDPFRPLLPNVSSVPYDSVEAVTKALEDLPSGSAAVILEPVQGEAGVRIPGPEYLAGVRAACDEHGALLIMDEIQTGLGRLGTWWGHQNTCPSSPDILLAGKALSGGVVPIAAVLLSDECARPFAADPYLHTSTFAASPLACAAATAALAVSADLGIPGLCASRGEQIRSGLESILATDSLSGKWWLRGTGLLLGMESTEPGGAAELYLDLMDAGVLVNHSLNCPEVIRLTPSALITDSEVDQLLTNIARVIR